MSEEKKNFCNTEAEPENTAEEQEAEVKETEAEATEAAKAEEAAAAACEEAENKYLRLLADYQNLKRRTEQEKSDIYAYANEKIVKDVLDVIDNFERALTVDTADAAFKEGMELILKQLRGALEKAGAAEIEALGKEFDPNFHNAVMTEDSEEYESGTVARVMQKGYVLNGRVVRPAAVSVAN